MTTSQEKTGLGTALAATLFVFLLTMGAVMMPIAASAIVEDLKTDVGMIQVAIASTSLVAASLYITGSKLGDIYGKKKLFIFGVILYGAGTVISTLTPNIMILVVGWAVVRSIGIACAVPAAVGLLIANYPDEKQRARIFAIYGIGIFSGALIGPLLMGFSAELVSWRLPFGIKALTAVVIILMAVRSMRETSPAKGAKMDWSGTVLVFFMVASLILGSILAGRYGWWLARRPLMIGDTEISLFGMSPAPVLIAIGLVLVAILLARINRMDEHGGKPIFSMKLFDNRTFFVASLVITPYFIITGAVPFIIPVFLQEVAGFDSLQTAVPIVALSVGSIIFGIASGKLMDRVQPRTLMQVFLLVMAAGLILLYFTVSTEISLAQIILPLFIIGAGFGVVTSQLPNIQLSTLKPVLQGEGSGFSETGKEIGIGLGAAVVGSIMFAMALTTFASDVAKEADLTFEERNELILMIEDEAVPDDALQVIEQNAPDYEQLGKEAYVAGFQVALGIMVAIVLISFLMASFIPRIEPQAVKDKRVHKTEEEPLEESP